MDNFPHTDRHPRREEIKVPTPDGVVRFAQACEMCAKCPEVSPRFSNGLSGVHSVFSIRFGSHLILNHIWITFWITGQGLIQKSTLALNTLCIKHKKKTNQLRSERQRRCHKEVI